MKRATTWTIPRMWDGRTVAILCSGESMTQEAANQVRAARLPAIAINTTFRLAPWADILYGADAAWWHQTPDARSFAGLRVSMEPVDGVLQVGRVGRVGFGDHPDGLYTLCNSGAQALQIAVKAGAARILLLGMDMTGGHWHGPHAAPLRDTHEDMYPVWCDLLTQYAQALCARGGPEIVNCSPVSRLMCWPRMSLEDALARAELPVERAELPG